MYFFFKNQTKTQEKSSQLIRATVPSQAIAHLYRKFNPEKCGAGVSILGFLGGGMGSQIQTVASKLASVWDSQRESSLLTTSWSGSTDVFGGPASRHGSLNSLF